MKKTYCYSSPKASDSSSSSTNLKLDGPEFAPDLCNKKIGEERISADDSKDDLKGGLKGQLKDSGMPYNVSSVWFDESFLVYIIFSSELEMIPVCDVPCLTLL